jgi:hypothetical protein
MKINTLSKVITALLASCLSPNVLTSAAVGKTNQASQCSNPFPSTYKSSKKTKYVNIPALGIAVKTSVSDRLVYIKSEQRFTFMTPPEYRSYQCSLNKKVDYTSFYPYLYKLNYRVIKNPKKQSLEKTLKEFYKDTIFIEKLGQTKINGIEFLTTPVDQGDPTTGWFIPNTKPDIVVEYTMFCDCGRDYKDLLDDLKNIKNIVN